MKRWNCSRVERMVCVAAIDLDARTLHPSGALLNCCSTPSPLQTPIHRSSTHSFTVCCRFARFSLLKRIYLVILVAALLPIFIPVVITLINGGLRLWCKCVFSSIFFRWVRSGFTLKNIVILFTCIHSVQISNIVERFSYAADNQIKIGIFVVWKRIVDSFAAQVTFWKFLLMANKFVFGTSSICFPLPIIHFSYTTSLQCLSFFEHMRE